MVDVDAVKTAFQAINEKSPAEAADVIQTHVVSNYYLNLGLGRDVTRDGMFEFTRQRGFTQCRLTEKGVEFCRGRGGVREALIEALQQWGPEEML